MTIYPAGNRAWAQGRSVVVVRAFMGQSIPVRHEPLLDLSASADDVSQHGIRHLCHQEACILIQAC